MRSNMRVARMIWGVGSGAGFGIGCEAARAQRGNARCCHIAQHLIVQVNPPIPLQIIEAVPDGRTARVAQVDIGEQDFLAIGRRHLADRPPIGPGNQRTPQVTGIALFADSTGGGNKHVIDVCCRHRQVGRHAPPGVVEQRGRRPDPVVQAANDIGTLLAENARDFGKPDVPTDQHADPSDRCLEDWKSRVSRGEPQLLQVP